MEGHQLIYRENSLYRYPANPRQRLHHLARERAGKQGGDRVLPESPRWRAGLGDHLEHALPHVLRVLQSDRLGLDWSDSKMAWLPTCIPRDPLDCPRLNRVLCRFPYVLQREDRLANCASGATDLSRLSAGTGLAVRSGDLAPRSARAGWSDCVHPCFEAFWRQRELRRNAGIFAGDFLWRGNAGADALRRDPLLGIIVPGQTWPDDRLRTGHAQFLFVFQCRHRFAISAACYARDVRIASNTTAAGSLMQSC